MVTHCIVDRPVDHLKIIEFAHNRNADYAKIGINAILRTSDGDYRYVHMEKKIQCQIY